MLEACLRSIASCELPPHIDPRLIVVDNSTDATAQQIVADAMTDSKWITEFIHEATAGIPIARNRGIKAALDANAAFVAMIDDDERATPLWLSKFLAAAQAYDAEIFCGPVVFDLPESTPSWMQMKGKTVPDTGVSMRAISTANVFVRAHLFEAQGYDLRFDERLRFTGGSDKELFRRARKAGARTIAVKEAEVRETVPPQRTTIRWQLERQMRNASNDTLILGLHRGNWYALSFALWKFLTVAPKGIGKLAISFLIAPFSAEKFQAQKFAGMKDLAVATGYFAPFFGKALQPYRKIQGD